MHRFAANTRGRDYVVGDIHGHFDTLARLLAGIGFDDARDRLFCVGDLIDRGPDSAAALDLLDAPWAHVARGNHEQMMLDAIGGDAVDEAAHALWVMNGGQWIRETSAARRARLIAAAHALPLALEVETGHGERIGIVHADVPGGDWSSLSMTDTPDAATAEAAIWSRETAGRVMARLPGAGPRGWLSRGRAAPTVASIDRVYHGHTPMPAPIACGNTRWLDTGVFLPEGGLSVAAIDDDIVWCLRHDAETPDTGWRVVD